MASCGTANTESTISKENKDESMLGANLYLQSAAEFALLCRQAYENAGEAVVELSKRTPGDKPFAVVMDLDETVVDNSAYQSYLYKSGESYNRDSWDKFVKEGAVKDSLITLVPGVYDFIEICKSSGIQVVFISNRMNSTRMETAITLANLGIDTLGLTSDDSNLMLLRTSERNKDARRDIVRESFDPQIFIGDNISDFTSDLENLDQSDRRQKALGSYSAEIGKNWFLIPNPSYGDWVSGSELRNKDYTLDGK